MFVVKRLKEFKIKSHLLRHCALVHGLPLPPCSPRPVSKTRTAFYLGNTTFIYYYLTNLQTNFVFFLLSAVTPTTRLARRFCAHLLRPRHAARFPFLPISAAAIRQDCKFIQLLWVCWIINLLGLLKQSKCAWHARLRPKCNPWCCVLRNLWHQFVLRNAYVSLIWLSVWLAARSNLRRLHGSFYLTVPYPNQSWRVKLSPSLPRPPVSTTRVYIYIFYAWNLTAVFKFYFIDGSLIYDKIVLPQREPERLKRRPDDSPMDGNLKQQFLCVNAMKNWISIFELAPPFKRSARESPSNVTSPLSVLAPLSGLAMGISASPTPNAAAPFLPNLTSISSLPISSLRPNIPPELYVSALANSSGLAPLLPGAKGSPSPSSAISPTVKPGLLPAAPQSLVASNPLAGRGARHGGRGALHGHTGGRIKQLPTWMDAPDDLFFHSTQVTKWVWRCLIVSWNLLHRACMGQAFSFATTWCFFGREPFPTCHPTSNYRSSSYFNRRILWILGNSGASWPPRSCGARPANLGDRWPRAKPKESNKQSPARLYNPFCFCLFLQCLFFIILILPAVFELL